LDAPDSPNFRSMNAAMSFTLSVIDFFATPSVAMASFRVFFLNLGPDQHSEIRNGLSSPWEVSLLAILDIA
jgi:hypothetical protein